jgi:hypothetical protein
MCGFCFVASGDDLPPVEAVSKWDGHYAGEEVFGCGILRWTGKFTQRATIF